ncbi:MAG TPA: helical backbone metal receptor, partial [Thermoanaerobaculia bacterium]|nr:helical backbone metal receptor [Thermoanaerobaculia bacterium]
MNAFPRLRRSSFILHRSALVVALLALSCGQRPATTHDDLGRAVTLPPRVSRLITLAPNLTELVFAIGAGDRLVGVDDFSNFPGAVTRIEKVGGMQPNIERIVALKPDLVLASTEGNHPNLAPALAAVNIPLFVIRTDRLDEVPVAMERLGTMLNAPHANEAARALRDALAAQRGTRTNPPRVMFAVWTDPLYVAGRETFTDDILKLTGAQNAVQVAGWPQYSLESFVANPPGILLYPRSSVTT